MIALATTVQCNLDYPDPSGHRKMLGGRISEIVWITEVPVFSVVKYAQEYLMAASMEFQELAN